VRKKGPKTRQKRPILSTFTLFWRLPERLFTVYDDLERDFFAYCSSNPLFGALQVNKFVDLQGIIFNFDPIP
jgi:hypothetical protein